MTARYINPRKGYIERKGKYCARMTVDGRQIHIGTFDTPEEAHRAYIKARSEVFEKPEIVQAREGGVKTYTPARPCKNGHLSEREVGQRRCIECRNAKARERDKSASASREKKYRDNLTGEKKKALNEAAAERSRQWRKANPKHHNALTTAHKKTIKQRTPAWANISKIIEVYKTCPDGYHVDHIVPLRGKNVSGLHVASNLQHLPAKENIVKSNKFPASELMGAA